MKVKAGSSLLLGLLIALGGCRRTALRSAESEPRSVSAAMASGLAAYYAFAFQDSLRAFEKAAALDPNSPMAFWGVAMAQGPNYNGTGISPERRAACWTALSRARSLAAAATPRERAYIEALELRYAGDAGEPFAGPERRYANAMRSVAQSYPDDPDAAVLYAEALMDLHPYRLWADDGSPGDDTPAIVSTLEGVLKRWPDHVGANHFYIHALEGSPWPARALPSARRLPALAAHFGHLLHMPSHIYVRTGDFAAAVKANQAALVADRPALTNPDPAYAGYAGGYADHNYIFLAYAAGMAGDAAAALDAARALQSESAVGMAGARAALPLTLVRFALWSELDSTLPPPPDAPAGLRYVWHYARAASSVAQGRAGAAETERSAMAAIAAGASRDQLFAPPQTPMATLDTMLGNSLDARMASSRHGYTAAIGLLRDAVAAQDSLGYQEPPVLYPLREPLGAALLAAGRAADAEAVLRESLRRVPGDPWALYLLARSLNAQGRAADAALAQGQYLAAWQGKSPPPI